MTRINRRFSVGRLDRQRLAAWPAVTTFLAVALTGAVAAFAQDAKVNRKPQPPPGVDPGGVMVAFIGAGIDYMRPALSRRLARDGEGEIIGFDLVDRDRRPFCGSACAAETDAAERVLAEAPQSRLAVFRVDAAALAAPALQMAVQAKAAIVVVMLPDDPQTTALMRAASERFRDTLIISAPRAKDAAGAVGEPADGKPASVPAAAEGPAPPTAPGIAGPGIAGPGTTTQGVSSSGGTAPGAPAPAPAPAPVQSPAPPVAAGAPPPVVPPAPDTVIALPSDAGVGRVDQAAALAARAAKIVADRPSTRGPALKAEVETAKTD